MLDVFVPFLFPPFSRSILSLFPVRDIYICELLLLMIYSFPFSLYAPFHFLRAATPPADLSSAHPCPVSVVYHYRVSPKYIHCHHHIVLMSFSSSRPVYSPLFVSGRSFSCSSSHCVLFFSLVFFYVVVHPIFSGVRRNFTAVYLYYSVGQIFCTCPPCQFPTAFCSFSL